MRRAILGAVLLILACGGAATLPAPSQATPARNAAAPTATIDVSDMMGAFPAATFFVVTDDGVKAIALLNHATKYTIPTTGAVQVAAGGNQIYIADESADGTRLRWIDADRAVAQPGSNRHRPWRARCGADLQSPAGVVRGRRQARR